MKSFATSAEIGQEIRRRRRELGIKTLHELALITGHSVRFVSEVERGKNGASLGAVLKICEGLGIDLFMESRP